ncbi:MAG: hypothetical protein WDA16_08535 [Candidatus Thermoplasmatota archaeon]
MGIILMTLAVMAVTPTGAALQTQDAKVTSLTLSAPFINLNKLTTATLTINGLHAAGPDAYKLTVYAPDGSTVATSTLTFTAAGSQSLLLGNATQGFNATVTKVGTYTIQADYVTGSTLTYAASVTLQTTDKLFVRTEFAAASTPYYEDTNPHVCPVAEEFQRGDEIIARGYVHYVSTGEPVTAASVSTATGNVTGTLFNITKSLTGVRQPFWRAAWFISWDQSLGSYPFTVVASDGLGNSGTGVSVLAPVYGALKIIPSKLTMSTFTTNATSGEPTTAFYPNEVVGITARADYNGHYAHNANYTNTTRALIGNFTNPGPGNLYRLGTDRNGVVTAAIGSGAYNAISGTFANQLAKVDLTFDNGTGNWTGKWDVPAGVELGAYSVRVTAKDGAPTANSGTATLPITTLAKPLPIVKTEIQYVNNTIEVEKKTPGLALPLVVSGIAVVALALRTRRDRK